MKEKIHKILSNIGYNSRREIEKKIIKGNILVNGKNISLGEIVTINKFLRIQVDGNLIPINNILKNQKKICRVLMYNKKEGEICTNKDPQNRRTVFDNLPKLNNSRWISVGRLDINTCGLLLFTNNGELANRLMHPNWEIERKYKVRIFGNINKDNLYKLKDGIKLNNNFYSFKSIKFCSGNNMNKWFEVSLKTGKNHEIRILWNSINIQVNKLIRVSYGNIFLPKNLKSGCWLELNKNLLNNLKKLVKL